MSETLKVEDHLSGTVSIDIEGSKYVWHSYNSKEVWEIYPENRCLGKAYSKEDFIIRAKHSESTSCWY